MDSTVSISQELEIGGQGSARSTAAQADLAAAEASYRRELQRLAAEVQAAYAEAVRMRELARIEEQDAELARRFASYATRRFEAGATSPIESNFAQAGLGRVERELGTASVPGSQARQACSGR